MWSLMGGKEAQVIPWTPLIEPCITCPHRVSWQEHLVFFRQRLVMEDQELRSCAVLAAEGDLVAMETLLRGIHPHLFAFLHLLGLVGADVDDVAQETAMAVYRSLPEYDRKQAFLPWMRGIARHVTAMHRRQHGRRLRREDTWRESMGSVVDGHESGWDVERLRQCVDLLDGRSKALVFGLYHDAQTSDQLGAALGMTAIAVRKAIMVIRRHLRRCVEGGSHA